LSQINLDLSPDDIVKKSQKKQPSESPKPPRFAAIGVAEASIKNASMLSGLSARTPVGEGVDIGV